MKWTISNKWQCPKGLFLKPFHNYNCKSDEICCVQNLYTYPINPYCCKKEDNGENFDARCKVAKKKTNN